MRFAAFAAGAAGTVDARTDGGTSGEDFWPHSAASNA